MEGLMTDSPSHLLRTRVFLPAFKETAAARLEAGEAQAGVARSLDSKRKILYQWRNAGETGGEGRTG
jgi:Transposase